MENFSIESANKTILVNNVELHLNFDDDNFMSHLTELGEKLKNFDVSIKSNTEELSKQVDVLFGENTCFNIFKCQNPNIILLMQLFEYINKFVEDYRENYVSKIADKYNPDRIGDSNV